MTRCSLCATSWNTGRKASRSAVMLCTYSRGSTLTLLVILHLFFFFHFFLLLHLLILLLLILFSVFPLVTYILSFSFLVSSSSSSFFFFLSYYTFFLVLSSCYHNRSLPVFTAVGGHSWAAAVRQPTSGGSAHSPEAEASMKWDLCSYTL